jgi:transposase
MAYATRWLEEDLGTVIWSDETIVKSHPNNRRKIVYAQRGTPIEELPYRTRLHGGGNKCAFWGCISKHGKGPLVSFPGSMNSAQYIEILRDHLVPEFNAGRHAFGGTWRFMQDGAPCHTSRASMAFLAENNIPTLEWPAYSPDLNPIENLWAWMKNELDRRFSQCRSSEELERRIFQIWQEIPDEFIQRYCVNYERRLEAVLRANGGHTKY